MIFYLGNKTKFREDILVNRIEEIGGPGGEGKPAIGYADIAGLRKAATIQEIDQQGWCLNPGPIQASKIDIPLPPQILRERIVSIAEPIGRHIVQLYNVNQKLRRNRDQFLPNLLKG